MKLKMTWRKWCVIAFFLLIAFVVCCFLFAGKKTRQAYIGGVIREYKDISVSHTETAIEWPWEYQTVYEKFSCITYNEKEYMIKTVGLPVDETLIGEKLGIGEAFHNVILKDSLNKIHLYGHYGYYKEEGEIGIITDSAMMVEYSQKDTTYIHGDTLYSYAQGDEENKMNLVYHNVRLFNNEFQGVCDSLTFFSGDSILHLMQMPIIWNEDQQITGDTIHIYPKNGSVDKMHVINNAMMIQEEDTIHYNQVSGKEIIAYIQNEELHHVDISGNVESLFYPNDEEGLIGLNSIKSSYMTVYFEDGKLQRFIVFPSPTAVMYPMSQITENMLYLLSLFLPDAKMPLISKEDIFRNPKRLTQSDIDAKKEQIKQQEQEERKNKRQKRNQENATDFTNIQQE